MFSQLDEGMIVAGVNIPIKLPQIIPGNIVPVISKFDTLPMPRRTPVASNGPDFDLLGNKLQACRAIDGRRVKFQGVCFQLLLA